MNRGGRKRTRGAVEAARVVRRAILEDTGADRVGEEELECDTGGGVDVGRFEAGCFACRCSLRSIREVFSKFPSYKKDLVKALGFEGLLNFPSIKQFNRRFAMWLMMSVHVESGCLKIGEHVSIKISKSDAVHVLGLPCTGKKVVDARMPFREAKEAVLNNFLGSAFREHRSIKVVQSIIEREYTLPLSAVDEEKFKVAFVVFVVSTFLAPSAKNDYASIDYWNAIVEPRMISTYDWAEYVVVKLFEAVSKLKQDMASNLKFPILTGCSIFLQVLYLDSLDLGDLSMSHTSFPRIRDFPYERMCLMIEADGNFQRHMRPDDGIACSKLRDPKGCIYSWAAKVNERCESRGGCLLGLWEAVTAMVHLLNIPFQAAGPLFVAVADFQEQVNSGLMVTGSQAIKFLSVLVSIMIPFCRGCVSQHAWMAGPGACEVATSIANGITLMSEPSRQGRNIACNMHCSQCSASLRQGSECGRGCTSTCCSGLVTSDRVIRLERWDIGDHVEKSLHSAMAIFDEMPSYLDVGARVTNAMTQYYAWMRDFNRSRGFHLNSEAGEGSGAISVSGASCSSSMMNIPAPWEAGYVWYGDRPSNGIENGVMDSLREHEGMVIVHRDPKYIQVSGVELFNQVSGNCEMDHDLFDALVRAVRQRDDECYEQFGQLRWRVFFESDFMDRLLSGLSDPTGTAICDNLLGEPKYDLSDCKIFFMPALMPPSWVCFAWNLVDNVIYVFDPSRPRGVDEGRLVDIERASYLLKLALQKICSSVWPSITQKCRYAGVRMLVLPDVHVSRFNRSGALCYMFMCCFDGFDLYPRDCLVDTDRICAAILKDVFQLRNNGGRFPETMIAEFV